ncbi:surface antigen-like protein [Leptomonas pyrrhocoris]|uniref:Surface antigen-like protein n=1 Tax=Leptomonas pyrrhocoris TaxID=157538 RepID=A0A0M9G6N8_LEPPY|nr:surface antigen-like protein [Leptomonas pyrrhocoris]KPA83543.1 surface antigen-like protein [Leptomonas pyrrhocoris]|eukprot:XP_015661982.1 surface antigen-like protein [Leptomonas pyrrhocoris]
MAGFTRALCIAALFVATLTVASAARSCGIDHCTTCIANYCTWCEGGFYAWGGTCNACTANCRSCVIAGRCTSCNDGYTLTYFPNGTNGKEFTRYGACEVKGPATACSDPQCTSCIDGTCLYCSKGFYAKDGRCASCEAAHCTHCEISGRCLACDAGYYLRYVNSTENETIISHWGTCINGATFFNAYAVLVGTVVVALTLMVA